jgi:hypothetical protein
MVHIDEITKMVEKDLDDFYRDRDRFKGFRLLINFDHPDYQAPENEIQFESPKFKKKQRASQFIKNNNRKKGLF